jgi:hypothetical protein
MGVDRLASDAGLQVLAGRRPRVHRAPRRPKGLVSDNRERGLIGSVRQVQHAATVLEQARHAVGLLATMQPCLPCQWRLHHTNALILKALCNV